jgi:predicted DsbA family dithiol-disulfide isomerase
VLEEVKGDIKQAAEIGAMGVPFFVINRKYAISGSRSEDVFSSAILKAVEEG